MEDDYIAGYTSNHHQLDELLCVHIEVFKRI